MFEVKEVELWVIVIGVPIVAAIMIPAAVFGW